MAGLAGTPPYIHPLSKAKPNSGGRQSAIAQHLGAPRFLNRASGKMETRGAMKTYHRETLAGKHGKPSGGSPGTSGGKSGGGGGQPGGKPAGGFNLDTANQGDIHNRSVTLARLERNAALSPLEAQGRQIQANEQGVQQSFKNLQGSADQNLQKLGGGQAASAKTFENQAAENALTAGKAIETAGQTANTLTGGYTSPELKAQLALSSQQAAGTGGAGSQFAQNIAAGSAAQLAQMRGAASLKALGGSQAITNTFQKQQQGVQQAQQGVLAKVAPRALEIEGNLGKEQYTRRATREALGLKGASLKQAGELGFGKLAQGAAALKQKGEEGTKNREIKEKVLEFQEAHAGTQDKYSKMSANDQHIYKQAEMRYKRFLETHGGKAPDKKEGRGKANEVEHASAIAFANGVRKGSKDLHGAKQRAKEAIEKAYGGVAPTALVTAAMNVAYYGRLSKADRAWAESYGLTGEIKPNWFKG